MTERKPKGYWQNWENAREELTRLIEELGHFPTSREFRGLSRNSLAKAIWRDHGGITMVKEKMGHKDTQRPRGYWKDWDNVERELKGLVVKLGHFPTQKELYENNLSGLPLALDRHYGGISRVRERMGYGSVKRPAGYWQDWNNVGKELAGLIGELGHFPTSEEAGGGLRMAITRYYGGFLKVRERMGHGTKKHYGYWGVWENIEREVKGLVNELGHFPIYAEVRASSLSGLIDGLRKHHKISLTQLGERMGYDPTKKPYGYWRDFENVRRELEPIIEELGHFPTRKELNEANKGSLGTAMLAYHGGTDEVRQRMGQPSEGERLEAILENYVEDVA